jgi:AraC-like DNA-binding protein
MPNGVFICCEIVDIKGLYGKYGSEKIQNIVRSFSAMLADSLSENEVCGMASFDRICAFVTSKEHSQKIFHFIKKKISSSSTPFTFTYGETIADYSRIQDMSDMYSLVGEALNNTTHSFTIHSCGNRELYEKLYHLRREIESKPEYPWNINEMRRKLNISKSTIQKNYKEYFGKSIFEDLIQFRIEKSKHLLTETDTSISEIAVLCDYSSDSYFMKQFKKEVGVTPTQYRKKYP